MQREILATAKRRFAGSFEERFKCDRLLARLQITQVVPIDRQSAAFAYNLGRNVRPGQTSNRRAKNLMSSEYTSQGGFERLYVKRSFD